MTRIPLMLRPRVLAGSGLVVAALGGMACQDARPTGVLPSASLTQRTHAPAATTPLAPLRLETQADFDALETKVLGRRRVETLLAAYTPLVGDLESITEAKALLLQRMIRLKVDAGSQQRLLSEGLGQSRRLSTALPDNPHAVYLEGYIRRKLLISDGGASALLVTSSTLDAAKQVIFQWERLLRLAPDYVGPDGHDAKGIRADLDRLAAAVAQLETAPATDKTAPIPRVAAADKDENQAWTMLADFDAGDVGTRRIVCREWRRGKRGPATGTAALTLDFHCGIEGNDAEAAIVVFEALAKTDVAIDRCAWAARILAVTTTGNRASVEARVASVAPACAAE